MVPLKAHTDTRTIEDEYWIKVSLVAEAFNMSEEDMLTRIAWCLSTDEQRFKAFQVLSAYHDRKAYGWLRDTWGTGAEE